MAAREVPRYHCMPDDRGAMATPPWSNQEFFFEKMQQNVGSTLTAVDVLAACSVLRQKRCLSRVQSDRDIFPCSMQRSMHVMCSAVLQVVSQNISLRFALFCVKAVLVSNV